MDECKNTRGCAFAVFHCVDARTERIVYQNDKKTDLGQIAPPIRASEGRSEAATFSGSNAYALARY